MFRKLFLVVKLVILLAVLAALGAGGYAGWIFYRAMPLYAGQAALPGLTSPVRVVRDEHGVPHIFADNMNDAARALGYLHAGERLFQMEMQRRAGQGRLSEILGPDTVKIDKFIRTLDLYHLAESSFASLSPDAQAFIQAYTEGVNAWLNTHGDKLPPEFLLLKFKPETWKPADSVVWSKLMALQLSKNYELEILRAELTKKLTPPQMAMLFPSLPADAPVTLDPHSAMPIPNDTKQDDAKPQTHEQVHPSTQGQQSSSPLEGEVGWGVGSIQTGGGSGGNDPPSSSPLKGGRTPFVSTATPVPATIDTVHQIGLLTGLDHAASNEWVIAGSRTESGKPILANDPHLGLEAPVLWYLARIVTPDLSIEGATVPGLPIVLLGQNGHVAWGFTTTGSDVQDLFIESFDPLHPDFYLTPEGSERYHIQTETIHVKDGKDVVMEVRTTRHGPVLSDIDPDLIKQAIVPGRCGWIGETKGLTDGPVTPRPCVNKVVALAFTALGKHDTSAEALIRLNRARNAHELFEALKLHQAPPQNVVYADTEGTIGFINPGLVPIRKSGDGTLPSDGASGEGDWIGMVPFDKLPQMENPQSGFIFNANNAIVDAKFPYFMGVDWEESWRAERMQQFFDSIDKHTLDSSAKMQADHVSLAARALLPYLPPPLPAPKGPLLENINAALALLHDWDGTMDKDRPEPLIFDAWLYELHRLLLVEKTGLPLTEKGPYAATSMRNILAVDALGKSQIDWCAPAADCHDITAKAFNEAIIMLTQRDGPDIRKWRWGDESITLLRNKFWSHVPVLKEWTKLDIRSGGDFYTLDRGGSFEPDPDQPFARTHGGGYRGIYDLADPDKSRFMITTGESSHIFSRHYGDLVKDWNDVKSFTLSGTHDELVGRGLPELVLSPK